VEGIPHTGRESGAILVPTQFYAAKFPGMDLRQAGEDGGAQKLLNRKDGVE